MTPEDLKPRITVDDLLRLKRAERPAPEFWVQFEQELRARQLAAIVEPKPWWCALPRFCVFILRHRAYLGSGCAALVAAGVGLRIYTARSGAAPAPAPAFALAAAPAPAPAEPAAPAPAVAAAPAPAPARVALALARPAAPSSQALPLITMSDEPPAAASAERFENLSRSLTVNLASAESAVLAARGFAAGERSFDSRLVPASAPVAEPLAHMASPSEERRSRLRDAEAFSAMAGSAALAMPAGERRVSRLDDRMDSEVSRYNFATGRDEIGVSIRF